MDARNGKSVTETISDHSLFAYLSSITVHTLNKRAFSYNLVESLASAEVSYHSFTVSSTKDVIIFLREITVSAGPVEINTLIGATYTSGTVVAALNSWAGESSSESVIQSGLVGVTGGTISNNDFIPSAGNKIGGFSESGGIVILPKGFEFIVEITNSSNQTNKIGFFTTFAEIDLDFLGV